MQHGYWQWLGDPIVPSGLVELIESRIGALPTAVGDVIDALAVGEPIELASLNRIADPAAVEEADMRGLIALDHVDGGIEVRLAHPLYGEVRRRRAPTRLRRLRGLVAAELAAPMTRRHARRGAPRHIESGLRPRRPNRTCSSRPPRALCGSRICRWPIDWPKRRSAPARDGSVFHSRPCTVVARPGQEAEAVLAGDRTTELTDDDRARLAYLRASNMLFALADPAAREEAHRRRLADSTPAGSQLHRRLPHRVLVCDGPAQRPRSGIEKPRAGAARRRRAPRRPGRSLSCPRTQGSADRSGRRSRRPDTPSRRALSTLRNRFNIADAHLSALLLSGRIGEALEVAERVRRASGRPPRRRSTSVPPSLAGPRSAPASSIPHVHCWSGPR